MPNFKATIDITTYRTKEITICAENKDDAYQKALNADEYGDIEIVSIEEVENK